MKTIKELEAWNQSDRYKGYLQALKDVLELIDSKTIECTMQYGKWFIDLENLKERITG